MILVDTSVWVDHLRHGDRQLSVALADGKVWMHSLILGELACGKLLKRDEVLNLLRALPQVPASTDSEVLFLLDHYALMGRGIGYLDAHLLASARLGEVRLWTRDKRLHELATELNLAHAET